MRGRLGELLQTDSVVASGQDPYLAILDLRNKASASIRISPVQRLFGRRTKTLLPTAGTLLQPKIVERTEDKLKKRKAKQEQYYNKGTRELTELPPGDTAYETPSNRQAEIVEERSGSQASRAKIL